MARYLSLPITGNPAQALLQVQTRLGAVFGRRRVNLEYVHDDVGALTELIVVLADDLPEEDVRAFRRALENLKGTLGSAVEVPVGAGGAVTAASATEFPTSALTGFFTIGNVTVGGNLASGPNTLHTDSGGGSSGPNTLHTDGGGGSTHDLSTTAVTVNLPIQPGTLVLSGTIGTATETATDDGAGNFPVSTLLPSGGTIDYATGAMTGTTAALDASSTLTETHTIGGATHDLSTTRITSGRPILPGTVTLSSTILSTTETVTDDGAGAFPTSTLLPSGGTILYARGMMSGTTAIIDGGVTITETHTTDGSLSAPFGVKLDSGATAGEAALGVVLTKSVGAVLGALEWSFSVSFAPEFVVNNNGVSGAQPLTLEARLVGGLASGQDIILRWTTTSDDTEPPAGLFDWGAPTFVGAVPAETPTSNLPPGTSPGPGGWIGVIFTRVSERVLRVSNNYTYGETFTFASDLVVPKSVVLKHNWGAALDRYFLVDDWSLSYALPSPA